MGWEEGSEKRKTDYPTNHTPTGYFMEEDANREGDDEGSQITHGQGIGFSLGMVTISPEISKGDTHIGTELQLKFEMEETSGSADRSYL